MDSGSGLNWNVKHSLRLIKSSEFLYNDEKLKLLSYECMCSIIILVGVYKDVYLLFLNVLNKYEPRRGKRTFLYARLTTTQISLRIGAFWKESSLFAWRNFASLAIQNAPSDDSDQIVQMRTNLNLRWADMSEVVFFFFLFFFFFFFDFVDNILQTKCQQMTFFIIITKTRLFKWKILPPKSWKLSGKNPLFSHFYTKHRLWLFVITASARRL